MTDTGQTASAPVSGDVVVPIRFAQWLLGRCRQNGWFEQAEMLNAAILFSAPRPSGDVAAKLAERLRHAASYMYDIHSQGGGWQTGKDVRPALLCDAADTLLSLTERIASLEQERTAKDAALNKIANDPYLSAAECSAIARRALGDQG